MDAGRSDLDPDAFYSFWEQRNIAHYYESYRTYKDICRLSLSESYERFGVTAGREEAIERYFDCFSSMELYPDVLPTLDVLARTYKLALVSNIDDDLLGATPLDAVSISSAQPREPRLQAGRHALPLPLGAIGAERRENPALRAIAVYRYGRRKAFWGHHRLDQSA